MKPSTQDQLKLVMLKLSAAALKINEDETYKEVIKIRDEIGEIVTELNRIPF